MIHPTAIVHPEARIPESCQIGPFCQVGPYVKMGENNILYSQAIIEGHTTLGSGNKIHPGAVLGGTPQDLKYKNEPTQLIIGDNNTFRECVTINVGTVTGTGKTTIGSNNLIMAYCHFGHDCEIGNNNVFANTTNLAGHVIIEDHVTLGGACFVGQFLKIGSYCYLGGGSFVEKDVGPYCTGYGNRFWVKGVNIIGLRRRGFNREDVSAVFEAHKIFYRRGYSKEQAIQEMNSRFGSNQAVKKFIDFVTNSKALSVSQHSAIDGDDNDGT